VKKGEARGPWDVKGDWAGATVAGKVKVFRGWASKEGAGLGGGLGKKGMEGGGSTPVEGSNLNNWRQIPGEEKIRTKLKTKQRK